MHPSKEQITELMTDYTSREDRLNRKGRVSLLEKISRVVGNILMMIALMITLYIAVVVIGSI